MSVDREHADLHVGYPRDSGFRSTCFENTGFMHGVHARTAAAGNNVTALILTEYRHRLTNAMWRCIKKRLQHEERARTCLENFAAYNITGFSVGQ